MENQVNQIDELYTRDFVVTDFGQYLKTLRYDAGVTAKELATQLRVSEITVLRKENGKLPPPYPEQLELWLTVLGKADKYSEAISLLRRIKTERLISYHKRNPATEHIDRIIDAYEDGSLDDVDVSILSLIAIKAYKKTAKRKNPMAKAQSKTTSSKSSAAKQLGSTGGKKGGPARAKKLSSLERSNIAKKGGKAKAAKNLPKKSK